MAQEPRGKRRLHHLEDEVDRDLARFFGTGRIRRRQTDRRKDRYVRRATRVIELTLAGELEAHVESVTLGNDLLNVALVASEPAPQDGALRDLERRLRLELATHLSKRHTPEVRVDWRQA